MGAGSASLAYESTDPSCLDVMTTLMAWEHEMKLLRDGQEVFVGPIADQVSFGASSADVSARDLFAWYERRTFPQDIAFGANTDLSDIFLAYATVGLSEDPSPNITVNATASGFVGTRSVRAGDFIYVADALRELGRDGVDWTMVGRTLRAFGPGTGSNVGVIVGQAVERSARLTRDGLGLASRYVVVGSTSGATQTAPPSGVTGGIGADTGLVTIVARESAITDQAAANQAAQAALDASGTEPRVLSFNLLASDAVDYDDLVPGNFVRASMTLGPLVVDEVMLLESVQTTASRATETIAVVASSLEST
jgi:hypothetical protein